MNGKNDELLNELVKLSKDYGILTPYTAFLAREEMDFSSVRNIQDNENFKIDELSKVSGEGAVSQRAYKQSMASNTTVNYNNSSTDVDGNEIAITTMKNIGDKTFFLKDGKWIESTLDEEAQKNVVKVKAFSDDYFNLPLL